MTSPNLLAASEIKVAPSWLSEQLKVRRDPDVFPALEQGQISVAQAAALSRAPAHARRSLLDRTIREHPQYRTVRGWVDEVRQAERKSRAQIAEVLAKGTTATEHASQVIESRYLPALLVIREVGAPESPEDLRTLQAIVDHCQLLLRVPDEVSSSPRSISVGSKRRRSVRVA
jgi:hypothetical protein